MSGERVDVLAQIDVTPGLVARMFWRLDADQQADFFAELERVAGINLCFQMASVIDAIRKRSEAGDYAAMHGLQTMLSHAQAYVESATDYRAAEAKYALSRIQPDGQGSS